MTTIMSWKENVLIQLKKRDLKEKITFEPIINSHVSLWNLNKSLIKQRRTTTTTTTTIDSSPASLAPSSSSTSNTKELEKKIETLQAELAATYKKEAKEATSQLALEAELRQLQNQDQASKLAQERLRIKLKETQALLEEETRAGARSREEANNLRDELFRVRRLLELAEGKNRQLSKENASLLERILAEKLKLAEELNSMSQINDELREKLKQQQTDTNLQDNTEEEKKKRKDADEQEEDEEIKGTTKEGFQQRTTVKRPLKQTVEMDMKGLSGGVTTTTTARGTSSIGLIEKLPGIATRFQAHNSEIPMIRFDESGDRLYTCSCDGTIKIWDSITGQLQKTLRCPVDVQLMGMDVKQKIVVGAGSDRVVRLWNLDTERVFHSLTGHVSKLYACCLTLDARTAITGGTDRKIMVWDVATGNRTRTITCSSICNAVAIGEDDSFVASGHQDSSIRMWDWRMGKMALSVTDAHNNTVTSVEFTRDGKILTNSRDNSLCIIDLVAGKAEKRFSHINYKSAYNWTSASSSSLGSFVGAGSNDGSIFIWNVNDDGSNISTCATILEHGEKRLAAFAFNPTASGYCASADEGGTVVLWKPLKE